MKGKKMSEWLNIVDDDQNLKSLGELITQLMTAPRRWYRSQVLQPTLNQGYYNHITGKYVLGLQSPTSGMTYTTVSVGSMTLLAGDDERIRVYYAGGLNVTQASNIILGVILGGITPGIDMITSAGNSQTEYNSVIGTSAVAGVAAGGGTMKELWLEPGDSLTLTNSVFAAGNNTEYMVLHQSYGV